MALRITAQNDGFRRCGIPHPAQPTDHPAGRFTEEQIAILKADPMLTVVEIEDAPDHEAEKKALAEKEAAEKDAADKKAAAEKEAAEKDAADKKAAADKEAAEKDAADKKAAAGKEAAEKKTPAGKKTPASGK